MTFTDLYRLLRQHLVVSLVLILLGAAAGVAWHMSKPSRYVASNSCVVEVPSEARAKDIKIADETAKSRARTYVAFAEGKPVIGAVASEHHMSTGELAAQVQVEQPPDSALVIYHVTNLSATTAQLLADDLGEQLSKTINARQTGSTADRLRVEAIPQTHLPELTTPWLFDVGLGLLAGLVAATVVAFWRRSRGLRHRDDDEAGRPVS